MDYKAKHTKNLLERFENKDHKKTAVDYLTLRKQVDGVTDPTMNIDILTIYHLSRFLKDKPFKDATKQDIRNWCDHLKEQGMNETSVHTYKMKLKRFYKYVAEPEKYENGKADQRDIRYPDCVRWISFDTSIGGDLPLESILNEKQIKKLLDGCSNAREGAILCCLLDGGLRKSELRNLKIKNVGFDKTLGAYLLLSNGLKTKQSARKIQLFLIPSSTIYLKEYLNHHQFKDDPEALLFYSMDRGEKHGSMLAHMGINQILRRILKRSGLKIHLTPHMCRHNSATMSTAKGFNEMMLRERYGWSKTSNMPARYVHLVQKDSDDFIKKLLGITEEDKPEESLLQPILCPNCEYENVPTNIVCGRCGMKLNIKKEDLGVDATTTGIATQEMLQDPNFREFYNDMLALTWEKYQKMKGKQN